MTSCCNALDRGTPQARADPHRRPGPYPRTQVRFIPDPDPPCKRAGPPQGVEGGSGHGEAKKGRLGRSRHQGSGVGG